MRVFRLVGCEMRGLAAKISDARRIFGQVSAKFQVFLDKPFELSLNLPKYRSKNHRRAAVILERGRKYFNAKDYVKAEECFRKAVRKDPQYGLAHYFLGLTFYKTDQLRYATQQWKLTLEVDYDSDAARRAKKKLDLIQGRVDAVIENLEGRTGQEK